MWDVLLAALYLEVPGTEEARMTAPEDTLRRHILSEGWRGDDADVLLKSVIARRDALNRFGGKRCFTCHVTKGVSAFEVDPYEHDGLDRHCVDCQGA